VAELATIGWSEYVDLPDWGITRLKAKTDTGARTSALHVEDLKALPDGRIQFHVVHGSRRSPKTSPIIAQPVKWGRVRSSNGHYVERWFVRTTLQIGPILKEIEISLVSREKMLFRMLIGRKALERTFLVDPSKRSILTKRLPKKRPKNSKPQS